MIMTVQLITPASFCGNFLQFNRYISQSQGGSEHGFAVRVKNLLFFPLGAGSVGGHSPVSPWREAYTADFRSIREAASFELL